MSPAIVVVLARGGGSTSISVGASGGGGFLMADLDARLATGRRTGMFRRVAAVVGVAFLVGCSSGSETPAPSSAMPTSSTPATTRSPSLFVGLRLVMLGDSWPEGAHCGGCLPFPDRYADGLRELTGMPISFDNLSGERVRDTATLLESLRSDQEIQSAVALADVVGIATGPNEAEAAWTAASEGTCGGADGLRCIRELGDLWTANLDAALTEIEQLRAGRPTAIRLLSADNPFFSVLGFHENVGLPADFAASGGILTFDLLTSAACDTAERHGGACIDVRPILNGPTLDQVVDVETDENHQAVADAMLATGLPELGVDPVPIIGEWVAIQECEEIASMLTGAGFDEFIAAQVYEFLPGATSPEDVDPQRPCEGAEPRKHSHFFTAGGKFGSKDYAARQVDDGTYAIRGSTLFINGASFAFDVRRTTLTLQPAPIDVSSCITTECRFQGAWVLMVSMPGTQWVRGVIAP